MNRSLLLATLAMLLTLPAFAAETAPEAGFWDSLRSKIEKVTPAKKAQVTTAVGGVRGSRDEADSDIYWKREGEALEVDEAELALFNQAVSAAVAGEQEAAAGLFEGFLGQYPASPLAADAQLALAQLRQP